MSAEIIIAGLSLLGTLAGILDADCCERVRRGAGVCRSDRR
ncbi:hypothetical protein [Agathobaculum butyriciproducens]